ncbi:hypothetical protein HOLleu_00946 [Holothuria leucospilota]|uniref:C2H2-type domain-containing protein n=1 Tax=Holothuria leucospilota TaxID=206669 RepID=A0A9Q1CPA8_HOLLE|nr:hypothetical protein HOLleu_00946 [Holothuria leucospilota]
MILADGKSVPVHGKAEMGIKIGGRKMKHVFWVADLGPDCILGLDFLKQHDCVIYARSGQVRLDGVENIPKPSNADEKSQVDEFCSRIVASETEVLPTQSEAFAPWRVKDLQEAGEEEEGMMNPASSLFGKKSVLMAGCEEDVGHGAVPVRLVNLSDNPVTVYRDTTFYLVIWGMVVHLNIFLSTSAWKMSDYRPLFAVEYTCGECPRRFHDIQRMRDHAEYEHGHRMFRCQICKDFSSARKADTIKHESHCGGRTERGRRHGEGSEERRGGGTVSSVVVVANEREGRTTDRPKRSQDERKRERDSGKGTGQRKEAKTDDISPVAGKLGSTSKGSGTERRDGDRSRREPGSIHPMAVVHPTPPRAQRRFKWPSLQQLLDLGSPLEERSASAEREIQQAERDELEVPGTKKSFRSESYQLTDKMNLITTTKRVVYPNGRIYEVEEKKIAPSQE